ncbi:glycerophosphodiester phosphodiesterase family protein [Anaerolineales bacterium HSG25]|nr:glycerophosphodiester phosphodiesterase family protein [Anaerolineales bacterium HSG25]
MMKLIRYLFLTFITVISSWIILHLILRPKQTHPIMIGHRGAAGLAPENSLSAIKIGINHGARFIEVDVQQSSDGQVLVIHDILVDRTSNGMGAVGSLPWADLQKLDIGSHFSPDYSDERIPSLEQVFTLLQDHPDVTLVIEGKDPHLYRHLARNLIQIIDAFDMAERVIIISFDHAWLSEVSQLAPTIRTGSIWWEKGFLTNLPPPKIVDVAWPMILLDPTLVYRLRRQGKSVWIYTADNPYLMRLLVALGVEGITTNRPDLWANERIGE